MNQTTPAQKQVLIVGGGFGGMKVALELAKHPEYHVTLLSDQPYFRYYPATYHTATGGLYEQYVIPLNKILEDTSVTVIQGTAKTINRETRTIITEDGQTHSYEVLVLAMGSVANYFGIQGLEEFSYGVKSFEQIKRFKKHLHDQLVSEGRPDLNYVIVGAGPTGIELAGALPEYLHKIMKKHGMKGQKPHITLIEAAPRLLPRSPEKVSKAVERRLEKLGVTLKVNQKVEGLSADNLMVNGEPIQSHTVVWTAGTANHPFFKENDFALTERGKVIVDEYLRTEEGIYVLGDNANTEFSGLAATAVHDGAFVADDILARGKGIEAKAYVPQKPTIVMPVGKGWASVEIGGLILTGWLGWILHHRADWGGFHDLEPWWKASQQWMTEFGDEKENCPTCIPGPASPPEADKTQTPPNTPVDPADTTTK